jgi:ADP-ribose pyrophosphatase YjhB (NUDIX family)
MYKVFINNKSIFFCENSHNFSSKEDEWVYIFTDKKSLKAVVDQFEIDRKVTKIYVFSSDIQKTFNEFLGMYKIIDAAGGLVKNDKGEILFIFRYGKWDLPKGKLEFGETIEDAAIREVTEECGISKLKIVKALQLTFHIYTLNNKKVIKRSFWFEMNCKDSSEPNPQIEEHITAAKWLNNEQTINAMKNAYDSIKDLVKSEGYIK